MISPIAPKDFAAISAQFPYSLAAG